MHSQHDNTNTMLQQSFSNTTKSITRTTTEEWTENVKSNSCIIKEPAKGCNGSLSSPTKIVSVLHGASPSPKVIEDLKQLHTTGITENRSQIKGTLNGLSSPNSKRSSRGYADLVHSTPPRKDPVSLHVGNKVTSQLDSPTCTHIYDTKSTTSKASFNSGHSYARSQSFHEKSSNVYGGIDDGPLTIIGSWALQSLSDNMQSRCDFGVPNSLKGRATQSFVPQNDGVTQRPVDKQSKLNQSQDAAGTGASHWHFQASAGTLFQIRANHLVKLTCMLVLLIVVFSFVFHSRIRALEEEKKALFDELGTVKMHLQLLVRKMDDVVALAIPKRSQQAKFASGKTDPQIHRRDDQGTVKDFDLSASPITSDKGVVQHERKFVKRSAPGRTTKGLLYSSDSTGMNALNNETTVSYGTKMDDWTVGGLERTKSSKGNRNKWKNLSHKQFFRRLLRKELRKLRAAHRLESNELKQKLNQTQQQISCANLSCCNDYDTVQNSLAPAQSAFGLKNSRAVYLQIDGSSVNIKKSRQVIGPWYLPNDGNEIGFNDLWYNHLNLDANGTSVVFQESGLYLISAQVFYQLQHIHNSKPTPMGYRIHLKKNGNNNRRPLTIAECVPSFPSTVYQTCFTQAAWYVETHDEVFLEHFTDSLPMIEALRSGQTFLNLVRLH